MANFGHYKQYNYGNYQYAGEPASYSACGPFSTANVMNRNPVEIMDWMTKHGYASNKQGTIWGGINDCLSAYGYEGKLLATGCLGKESLPIFNTWRKHIQNGKCGILLMGAGKDTYWTSGGHYITIVGYRALDDNFLVIDSANDARDGWKPWSKFTCNIKNLYTCNIKWAKIDDKFKIDYKVCYKGLINTYVLLLQALLKSVGCYNSTLDGSFGNKTDEAVRNYQRLHALQVDGTAGFDTITVLTNGLFDKTVSAILFKECKYGDKNNYVLLAQMLLNAYGYYYGELDGSYGDRTLNSVTTFQIKHGMSGDGNCGFNTMNLLTNGLCI